VRVLVTGSCGFIGSYVTANLLARGYQVRGLDNFSKYGRVKREYPVIHGSACDRELVYEALKGCDYLIAGAARVGGIEYFHRLPYDLLAENERIMAATCDAAIAHKDTLKRVVYISSSMVYESTNIWPSHEGDERDVPPPRSSYGFQKLAVEYFARAAWEQYGLPYTIVRPFNCVGTGEGSMMAHVVPDLCRKILDGQDPLHIYGDGYQIRHYTYGGDLARGIVDAMECPEALNEDFNLSSPYGMTVLEVARLCWMAIHGRKKPFRYVSDEPFEHDVACRIPSSDKAAKILNWRAEVRLEEVIWMVIREITEAKERSN
jgi:UDP-glucose 4-epimerase